MTKLEMLKAAVSVIVGVGTTKIVHGIVANNVEINTPIDQVTVYAGSAVIGSMAADATKVYTDTKIDEIADWIKSLKSDTI